MQPFSHLKTEVAYKETIQQDAVSEGKFIRQSGGRGQYGHVWLKVIPQERGAGYVFENKIVGGTIPKEFIPGVQKGVAEALWLTRAARTPFPDPDGRFRKT